MNKELENLIDAALADNKLTGREMEIILKKAESLGVDKDEFEILIEAKLYKKKTKKSFFKRLNTVIYHRDAKKSNLSGFAGEMMSQDSLTIKLWHILAPVTIVLLGIIIGVVISIFHEKELTIDDYLTQYDFENARMLLDELPCEIDRNAIDEALSDNIYCEKSVMEAKIIQLEAQYLIGNDFFDKAIATAKELNTITWYNELLTSGQISISQEELIDQLLKGIVSRILSSPEKYDFNASKGLLIYVNDLELKRELEEQLKSVYAK